MSQLKRYFVERREGFQSGAEHLCETLRRDLNLRGLTAVRRFVRYDLDTVPETHVRQVMETILSEPFTDCIYTERLPETVKDGHVLAVEALPGQYDQRADSCAQCVELVTGLRPVVKTAMVYVFYGQLTAADQAALRQLSRWPLSMALLTWQRPICRPLLTAGAWPWMQRTWLLCRIILKRKAATQRKRNYG